MTNETTTPTAAAPESKDHGHDAELGFYYRIFYALLGLTALTVLVGSFEGLPDWLGLIVALMIASVKGSLVVLYFMHLKLERRNIYIIAGVPLVLALILLIALGPDIAGFAAT